MDEDKTSTDAVDETAETQATDTEVTDTSVLDALKDDETEEAAESTEESEESESEEETDGDETEQETEAEEESESTDETPEDRARREYQARQTQRQDAAEKQEALRQKQADDYIAEGEDEKDKAIRELQIRDYMREVKFVESSIANDYDSATKEIDLFNPSKPETFNQKAHDAALEEYQRGYVKTDEAGNVVSVAQPLKQFLRDKAELYGSFIQTGATKGQLAERKMRNKGETLSTKPPKPTKEDPILALLKSDD